MERKATDRLENFVAYQMAMELWDLFWQDSEILGQDYRGRRLVEQMVRSIDSIAANIEEGFGRGFSKEFPQFLRYARGSARESRGRYQRSRHLLPESLVSEWLKLLDQIIAILTRTIQTLERRHEH